MKDKICQVYETEGASDAFYRMAIDVIHGPDFFVRQMYRYDWTDDELMDALNAGAIRVSVQCECEYVRSGFAMRPKGCVIFSFPHPEWQDWIEASGKQIAREFDPVQKEWVSKHNRPQGVLNSGN